jgi:type IV pilus assembly protein PilM
MQPPKFLKDMFYPSTVSIGLDIGSYSVKIAQIKKSGIHKEGLLSFGVVAIKDGGSRTGIIEAIKQAYKKCAADSNKVNMSICGPNVLMRYIILPLMKEKDLAHSLEFELEKYIPYKKEEVVTDYRILAKLSNNKMIVLLVAVERQFIQARVSLVKEAGLEPQLINVDTLALSESFKAYAPGYKGVVAILDVGYHLSKLVVLDNNVPYFSRDIETGEFDVIQTIAEKLSLNFDKAKEIAYNPQDKAEKIAEVIRLTLSSLIDEIYLSFEYCERNLEKRVEHLYFSGGGSKIKLLLDSLRKNPNLKMDLLDPTRGFKISPSVTQEELRESSPLLVVAIGLALG